TSKCSASGDARQPVPRESRPSALFHPTRACDRTGVVTEDLASSVGTGVVWRPGAWPSGIVILIHGLQSHAGWFVESRAGEQLAAQGLAVYAPDRRGSGCSAGPRGDIASFHEWYSDLADVVRLSSRDYPSTP